MLTALHEPTTACYVRTTVIWSMEEAANVIVNDHLHRAILTDARARRTPWYEIVRAILDLQSQALTDPNGRPWIAYAQDVSGYNYIQLREMIRTYNTVNWLSQRFQMPKHEILRRFSKHNIEILSRIMKISEESAYNVFARMLKENLTVSALRIIYQEIKEKESSIESSISVGKKLSTDFEKDCLATIKKCSNEMFECFDHIIDDKRPVSCKIDVFSGRHAYVSPSFIVVISYHGGKEFVAAVDCSFTRIDDDYKIANALKSASFDAGFFSLFYIMMPSWAGVERVTKVMKTIQAENIGIISVDISQSSIRVINSKDVLLIQEPARSMGSIGTVAKKCKEHGHELVSPQEHQLGCFVPW
jgi:hypothetical protein